MEVPNNQAEETVANQEGWLEELILGILKPCLGTMTEENKKAYMPQLVAEAQHRIGLALLPKLDERHAEVFADMMDQEEQSPQVWEKFWRKAVPTYEQITKDAVEKFAEECRQILGRRR